MKLAPAEAKAIKFVLLLIGLSALARWITRPRPLQLEQSLGPHVSAVAPATNAKSPKPAPARINPNTATLTDLDRLPGIGEATARRIIEGRPYQTLDDLARVLGGKRASTLAKRLTLPAGLAQQETTVSARGRQQRVRADSADSTADVPIDLNRASQQELERLPGVGPALARRILSARQTAGGFRSWAQVDSVSGIGPSLLKKLQQTSRL